MNDYHINNIEDEVRKNYAIVCAIVLLLAAVLRFFQLGENSLWVDEARYANQAMTDFWSFINNLRNKNSSPILLPYLYFLFGESLRDPLLIRIPPALFSLLTIVVILALPRAGLSYSTSALAAIILAVAPKQVQYAQEVREYSLSVFVSSMIIFSYMLAVNKPSKCSIYCFSVVLFITPLASYGPIFIALAALLGFFYTELSARNYTRRQLLVPLVFLLCGISLTYQLTAAYQMDVSKSWYLSRHYPPDELIDILSWLGKAGFSYIEQAVGGRGTGSLALVFLFIYMAYSAVHIFDREHDHHLFRAVLILFAGSIFAALIGIYPFGGIRQHLFAAPLIVLCTVQSMLLIGIGLRKVGSAVLISLLALTLFLNSYYRLPKAYAEREDIVSAVTKGLENVPDADVYVYYGAKPAVNFHYPQRKFFRGTWARRDPERIASEIYALTDNCRVSILFSHVFKSEDDEILALLSDLGVQAIGIKKYRGASVATLSRCAD